LREQVRVQDCKDPNEPHAQALQGLAH